jgi:hypothetical protein
MLHIVCVTHSMVGNRPQADIASSPGDIPCEGPPRSMIWLLSYVARGIYKHSDSIGNSEESSTFCIISIPRHVGTGRFRCPILALLHFLQISTKFRSHHMHLTFVLEVGMCISRSGPFNVHRDIEDRILSVMVMCGCVGQ